MTTISTSSIGHKLCSRILNELIDVVIHSIAEQDAEMGLTSKNDRKESNLNSEQIIINRVKSEETT